LIQRRVWISGRVQGVGFRAHTLKRAQAIGGLRGYVRNLEDGRVEAVFCGQESQVNAILDGCRKGPIFAKVDQVLIEEEEPDPLLEEFSIDRD
jgi:acylphosphatase